VATYAEQAQSASKGFSRGFQKRAQAMLADLRQGAIDDLATVQLDRLTREHSGQDAAAIKEAARSFRASIITPARTYQVWIAEDDRAFDVAAGVARLDAKSRRDAFYCGIIVAATTRPVFRQKIVLGYRFEYERNPDGSIAIDSIGRAARRWWVKDEPAKAIMAAFAEAADRCHSVSTLLAYLNRDARHRDWITTGRRWKQRDLDKMLTNPVYAGKWIAIRNPTEETDVWLQFLEQYGPPSDKVHDVPELAYWTPGQIARWRRIGTPAGSPPSPHRTPVHEYPALCRLW